MKKERIWPLNARQLALVEALASLTELSRDGNELGARWSVAKELVGEIKRTAGEDEGVVRAQFRQILVKYARCSYEHLKTPAHSGYKQGSKPSLMGISHFADWFGIPTRKAIKALAGDYEKEIARLWTEGRTRTARWNKALAWGYAFWYVARSPFDTIVRYVMKSFRGGG